MPRINKEMAICYEEERTTVPSCHPFQLFPGKFGPDSCHSTDDTTFINLDVDPIWRWGDSPGRISAVALDRTESRRQLRPERKTQSQVS